MRAQTFEHRATIANELIRVYFATMPVEQGLARMEGKIIPAVTAKVPLTASKAISSRARKLIAKKITTKKSVKGPMASRARQRASSLHASQVAPLDTPRVEQPAPNGGVAGALKRCAKFA